MKNNNQDGDIDLVILWVDGSDPNWLFNKSKYEYEGNSQSEVDNDISRYRDWDNLKYVFRSIEVYAPWVRKVHFVTEGHVPSWLNIDYQKINHVKHSDFIPEKYLPTFNSNVIELNMHRIKSLNEKFILFNDDMFFTDKISKKDFFVNNLPTDQVKMVRIHNKYSNNVFSNILLNNKKIIDQNFDKKYFIKYLSCKNGIKSVIRNALLINSRDETGFYTQHMPSAFLKSSFSEVWKSEFQALDLTSQNKFRSSRDVSQYLIKDWQKRTGNFYPINIQKMSKLFYKFPDHIQSCVESIENHSYSMICINDGDISSNFEDIKKDINKSFNAILPNKSKFEL